MAILFHMAGQRRRDRIRRPVRIPAAAGLSRTCRGDFAGQLADFSILGGFHPAHLPLQRADAGYLPHSRRNTEAQQIARDIERAGAQVAVIGVRLHRFRLRELLAERFENFRVHGVISGQQFRGGFGVKGRLRSIQFRRRHKAGFRKILIARRSSLPVPKLLVLDFGGRELRDSFETHHHVPKIGDGGVPVLKIKALQEFRGIVRPDPLDGIADGIRRAAVARQGVSTLLSRHRPDRDHAPGGVRTRACRIDTRVNARGMINLTHHPLNSPANRLANGRVCPAYLFPTFFEYGIDDGDESCSKVNEQIRIPGYSATGMRLRLLNSSVALPAHPGSNNPAVPCTMMPMRPRLDRPSSRPSTSSSSSRHSSVMASTNSRGCKINASPVGTTTLFINPSMPLRSLKSMNGCRLCSNTLNSFPSRKSTEQLPNCSAGSSGVMRIFPRSM